MPWQAPTRDGQPRRYFIWGATAAMLRNLYRFLARLSAPARRAGYHRPRMSFFAVLFALLIEQLKPLPRGNVRPRHADRAGCAGPAATSTPAATTTPGWSGASRCSCRRCWPGGVYLALGHFSLLLGAGAGTWRCCT